MQRLHIRVANVAFRGGEPNDYAPNIRFFELSPTDDIARQKGNLYIHADVIVDAANYDRLSRSIVTSVQQQYYQSEAPIGQAIETAIQSVHRQLQAANRDLPEEKKQFAGMTCLVIKDGVLYVGQVGTVSLGVVHEGKARWFSPLGQDTVQPLGGNEDVTVLLNSVEINASDVVLSLDSGWLGEINQKALTEALLIPQADIIAQHFATAFHPEYNASALILSFHEPLPGTESVEPAEERAAADLGPTVGQKVLANVAAAASRFFRRGRQWLQDRILVRPTTREEDAIAFPPSEKRPAKERASKHRRWRWPFTVGPRHARNNGTRWLWIAVVLIPLLLILGTLGLWWRGAQAKKAQFQQQVDGVKISLRQAMEASDANAQQRALEQASTQLEKAKELEPDAPILTQLERTIAQESDRINKVFYPPLAWLLHKYSGAYSMRRVVVSGQDIFVLDAGNSWLYYHKLASSNDQLDPSTQALIVLKKGQNVNGVPVGDLVDLTWMKAGAIAQTGGPLVLDRSGHLFRYDESFGPTQVDIGRPTWQSPQAIWGYNNRLYLLDPPAGQIWRYPSTGAAFVEQPEPYFSSAMAMTGATDMAIDGDIYVLFPDGRLLQFEGGQEKPFSIKGLAQSVEHVTAFFTDQHNKYIYLADVSHNRIVQLDKRDGHFVRQMKPPADSAMDLTKVKSLFFDGTNHRLFILTDKELWLVPWPPESSESSRSRSPVNVPNGAS